MTDTENWKGGHPAGCISYRESSDTYIVRFANKSSKTFKTLGDARVYRRFTSMEEGLTKNMYRFVDNYVEVQLEGYGEIHIGKIDKKDFKLFKNCIWCAHKKYNRYYICHSGKKKAGIPPQSFHRLLYPQWEEIDHINRDGLDNRRKNLRNGKKDNINVTNQSIRKDNTSGKTGVHFEKSTNTWRVQYMCDGVRKKRAFSISKYGYEDGRQLAIQFRNKMDKQFNNNNGYNSDDEEKEVEDVIYLPNFQPELYKTNTSCIHGVYLNPKGTSWIASWTNSGKRGSKSFSIKEYGNDEAREKAREYRQKMRPQVRNW